MADIDKEREAFLAKIGQVEPSEKAPKPTTSVSKETLEYFLDIIYLILCSGRGQDTYHLTSVTPLANVADTKPTNILQYLYQNQTV